MKIKNENKVYFFHTIKLIERVTRLFLNSMGNEMSQIFINWQNTFFYLVDPASHISFYEIWIKYFVHILF